MPLGPDERIVFEEQATPLYEEIVTSGGMKATDARIAAGGELHTAFSLLVEVGLVTKGDDGLTWTAVDPAAVQARVVAPLGQQGAQMISESSHWANAFNTLGQAYRRSPSTQGGPVTELRGDQIDRFLQDIVSGAQTELLTAQPQAGRSAAALREAANRDIAALQRGLSMRTIYQHSARRQTGTREYVRRVTAEGEKLAPASALNRDDFPLPVPPASVTTVCAADNFSRSPARASRLSASATSSGLNPPGPLRLWAISVSAVSAASRAGRWALGRPANGGALVVTAAPRA